MLSAICLNLDQSKILSSGNVLSPVLPKRMKNAVEKRENACCQDCLLFMCLFQEKRFRWCCRKKGLFGKTLNSLPDDKF